MYCVTVPADMVYLDVLHTEHWRVGLLVLQAGKNMLCEKPFAMNSREVGDLIAASKKSNIFLLEVWERLNESWGFHKRVSVC